MTGQAQTETWRRELAATFAAASTEVLYVLRLQPEAAVEFVSPGIYSLLGFVPAEFYADPTLWNTVVDRDQQDTIRELTLGEAGEESNGIVRWVGKNGRPVWVHHRWLVVTRDNGIKALYGAARALRNEQRGQDLAGQVDYLRLLLENVTDVVFDIAADDTFRWVSPSTEQVIGWRPAELIGKASTHYIQPETEAAAVLRGHDPADAGRTRRFQVRTASGGQRWMSGLWRETRDHSGTLLGHIAGLHDIEDTVRAEQELASSREHYRLLAENGSDLVFQTTAGPEISLAWVSPSSSEVLGWAPADMVGRSITEFVQQEDLKALLPLHLDVRQWDRGTYELRVRRADGSAHWMSVTVRPIVDSSGAVTAWVGSAHNIEAEVSGRSQLARSERRFRLAMESAPTGMAVVDLDGCFVKVNPALCRMVGRSEEWMLAHSVPDILDPEFDEADRRLREQILLGEATTGLGEKRLVRSDGSKLWVEHGVGLLRDEDGGPLSFVCQYVDVTSSRQVREDLAYLADHDPLTQLLTRRVLVEGLQRFQALPSRHGECLGILFVDVDHLKQVNDTYGHAAGDELLVQIARRVCDSARRDDLVARLGGDEFVVVLPGMHAVADAERVAAKIHQSLQDPITVAEGPIDARVSIGVAVADPAEPVETLLHKGDRALYAAKHTGRNRTFTYHPEMG